jgi:hypothetical protein
MRINKEGVHGQSAGKDGKAEKSRKKEAVDDVVA